MIQRFLGVAAPAALALALGATIPATAAPVLTQIASGFTQPLAISFTPDARKFVVEQSGRIVELLSDGSQRNFMTVGNIVTGGEKGLLNLAFPADFATSHRFYIYCTGADTKGRLRVEIRRYQTSADLATGNPKTSRLLLSYLKPFENHNGGFMAFGPDGYLYIGTGDGGSANDPFNNAQNLHVPLGKLLRVDVSGPIFATVPPTNPFVNTPGADKRIFAYGLRNPFRESFDSATGDLYVGDVGQDRREEVDVIKAGTSGQNFGWRVREGTIQNPTYPDAATPPNAIGPIYDYGHGNNKSAGQGEAITGGVVYHGVIPELQGRYVFADFVDGGLWSIDTGGGGFTDLSALLGGFGQVNPVSFGEDPAHNVYLVDYNGRVFRFDNQ